MEPNKISVIIPSYNQGAYIANCIKSVLHQKYDNWELLIQDGASTDNTSQVCAEFAKADDRIRFFSEKDKGFADAVNKALDRASGTLAVIQSSDDFFAYPNVFSDAAAIYERDNNLVLIAGASVVVDENLTLLATQERSSKYVPAENIYSLKDHFSQGATFFSLDRARKIGKLDAEVDMVADTDFWIRLICHTPVSLNSAFQTSKIWGCVTVQPEQRSADLSKFYLGRAIMATRHKENDNIDYSLGYKLNQANALISAGIVHFTAIGKDYSAFTGLYKLLNNKNYIPTKETIGLKKAIKRLITKPTLKKVLNNKNEMYGSGMATLGQKFNWFA